MRQQHQNSKGQVQEPSAISQCEHSNPVCLCMMTRKDTRKIRKIRGVRVRIEEYQSESEED